MKYIIRVGRTGTYGEYKHVEWLTTDNQPIASHTEQQDGNVTVTLYTSDLKPHPRTLPNDPLRIIAICEAHVREQGFDEMVKQTFDIRAYND